MYKGLIYNDIDEFIWSIDQYTRFVLSVGVSIDRSEEETPQLSLNLNKD